VAEILLNAGANINAINSKGLTALAIAAGYEDVELVATLLQERESKFGKKNYPTPADQKTALILSAAAGNKKIVKFLQDFKPRQSDEKNDADADADQGLTALHSALGLDLKRTAKILIQSGIDIKATNAHGIDALAHAHLCDSKDMVKFISDIIPKIAFQPLNAKNSETIAFFSATRGGHAEVAVLLLDADKDANINVNLVSNAGTTALIWAAWWGMTNITEKLLLAGANIHAENSNGSTALISATANRKPSAVNILLDHFTKQADAELKMPDSISIDIEGALIRAAASGSDAIFSRLLEFRQHHALKDHQGANALIALAMRGDSNNEFKTLMYAGAKTDGQDAHGKTALDYAIQCKNAYLEELLNKRQLEHANQIQPKKFNSIADILLLLALEKGRKETADHLLCVDKNCDFSPDVNAVDDYGSTPFILAASWGMTTLMKKLISAGANIDAENFTGSNALIYSSTTGALSAVNFLLELMTKQADEGLKTPADISSAIEFALTRAVSRGRDAVVSKLLEFRKDHALEDQQGAHALIAAVRREDNDMFEQLMGAGAKIDGKDADGKTALDYAIQLKNTHIEDLLNKRQLEQADQTAPTKLNSIADIALLLAVGKKYEKTADHLLDVAKNGSFSANVNAADIFGTTALMLAVDQESVAMVKKLLEQGANIHAIDKKGKTALEIAENSTKQSEEMTSIRMLLKYAAAPAATGDSLDDIDSDADAIHGDLSDIDDGDSIDMPDTTPVLIIANNALTDCGVVTTDAVFQA